MTPRAIRLDGSPGPVHDLRAALAAMLAGGPAVLPLGPDTPDPGLDAPAGHLVATTSGSTGEPKRVLLAASALRASATATAARLGGPGPVRPGHWLLALPAQHIAGIQVLVRAILAGTEPVVLDLRDGFDADAFDSATFGAAAFDATAGRGCTSLVPTQLIRLLDAGSRTLAGYDAVLLGGSAPPPGLVDRARAAGVRVVTTYGMSETAGGCVYDGYPLDGVRARLNGAGRIELAGPVLATGYLSDAAATAGAFRDGWFTTSDLGRIEPDGRVRVLGRADDVIVTGGVNVAPAEVEQVLGALPGVGATCVVGVPDARWGQRVVAAVVAADRARPPDPAALLAAARARLPGASAPKDVVLLNAIPLRGVGKPDRRAVRDLLGG